MNQKQKELQKQLDQLIETQESLFLATQTNELFPYASYAPFIKEDGDYYIVISKIAKHYENLKQSPQASIMVLEDENKATNIFFRKRVSYAVKTTLGIQEKNIEEAFIKKFGAFAATLFKMDFFIVKCQILHGLIVLGAGQAYQIDSDQMITEQVTNTQGHQKK